VVDGGNQRALLHHLVGKAARLHQLALIDHFDCERLARRVYAQAHAPKAAHTEERALLQVVELDLATVDQPLPMDQDAAQAEAHAVQERTKRVARQRERRECHRRFDGDRALVGATIVKEDRRGAEMVADVELAERDVRLVLLLFAGEAWRAWRAVRIGRRVGRRRAARCLRRAKGR
jgi:hypothetical protein